MTIEIFEIFKIFSDEDKNNLTKNGKDQNKQSQSREQENKNTIRRKAKGSQGGFGKYRDGKSGFLRG